MKNKFHKNGAVIWITGLSGAGKSSIARALVEQLRTQYEFPVLIDGDEIREAICDPHTGHDLVGRLANAYRISRLAKLIAGQGYTVIVATMSLFNEIHAWNRKNLPNYFEAWIEVDFAILKARDIRGFYSRTHNGQINNVPGFDLEYERPHKPDIILRNDYNINKLKEFAVELYQSFKTKS